ncbi:hypothetical protein FOL47_001642 [Perkinsus chesapeaki]|uniref:EF-hand domain-containing protein n=1 Tax=Perkinsus chesapeaki TaxID=330153 RepID=A0A7J6N1Y9_PERCH|nr:hypothetical protein FOL47_001642 [Perkinsus chesapeaki]
MGNVNITDVGGDPRDFIKRLGCDFCVPDRRLYRRRASPGSLYCLDTRSGSSLILPVLPGGDAVDLGTDEERLSILSERIKYLNDCLVHQKNLVEFISMLKRQLGDEKPFVGRGSGVARSSAVGAGPLLSILGSPEADTPRCLREWAAEVEDKISQSGDDSVGGLMAAALERLGCDLDHQMEYIDACPILQSGLGLLEEQEGQEAVRLGHELRLAKNTFSGSAFTARTAFKKMDVDNKGFVTLSDMRTFFAEGEVTGSTTPVVVCSSEEYRDWSSLVATTVAPISSPRNTDGEGVPDEGEVAFPLGTLRPHHLFDFLDRGRQTGLLRQEEFVMSCTPQLASILELILSRRKRSRQRFSSERIAEAVSKLELVDDIGDPVKITGYYLMDSPLDKERLERYINTFAPGDKGRDGIAVTCQTSDGETVEYDCINTGSGTLEPIMGTCQVMYSEEPCTRFLEYNFKDDLTWRQSQVTLDPVLQFRDKKFAIWKEQLEHPSCEAAFRRLLQLGLVTNVFDKHMFPTPEHLINEYRVEDENTGKLIDLPHPVNALRLWNASTRSYDAIDPHLAGAPRGEEEAKKVWEDMLNEFREQQGTEYINELLAGHRVVAAGV